MFFSIPCIQVCQFLSPGSHSFPHVRSHTYFVRFIWNYCSLFSCSVVSGSNSFWPHGLQDTRLPCPSLSPGIFSNSSSLSQWSHPIISSSVAVFSSCPQFFSASGSFPMSWLFTTGGQRIRASASASVLPMNIELVSFRIDWFDLVVQGTLKNLLQYHSSKVSILWHSVFFIVQLSHPYVKYWKLL